MPVPTNLTWSSTARYQPPWPTVHRVNDGPLAYRYLVAVPEDMTILELPFGDSGWDMRYVYYAGLHRKRIVNGYSGYFPDGYHARAARLSGLWDDRDAAWAAVRSSGATHLLVHRDAYAPPEGAGRRRLGETRRRDSRRRVRRWRRPVRTPAALTPPGGASRPRQGSRSLRTKMPSTSTSRGKWPVLLGTKALSSKPALRKNAIDSTKSAAPS